jgi:hypothetical protein
MRILVSMEFSLNFVCVDTDNIIIWNPTDGVIEEYRMESLINSIDWIDSHNLLLIALENGSVIPKRLQPEIGNPNGENLTTRRTDRTDIEELLNEILEIK